jgi:hypothetical protein
MASRGAVPQKCAQCDCLFEGECIRYVDSVGHYLHLDHGPCGIDGPTDPVIYENQFVSSKVEIPRKCSRCVFLAVDAIRGFHCTKDADKWGDFPRGLDWGTWEPDCVYLELPPPRVTTRQLSRLAHEDDLVAFIKEHRRINPGLSIGEAKSDFEYFRRIIEGRPK